MTRHSHIAREPCLVKMIIMTYTDSVAPDKRISFIFCGVVDGIIFYRTSDSIALGTGKHECRLNCVYTVCIFPKTLFRLTSQLRGIMAVEIEGAFPRYYISLTLTKNYAFYIHTKMRLHVGFLIANVNFI